MSEERVAVVFLSTHSRNVILTANIPILPLSLGFRLRSGKKAFTSQSSQGAPTMILFLRFYMSSHTGLIASRWRSVNSVAGISVNHYRLCFTLYRISLSHSAPEKDNPKSGIVRIKKGACRLTDTPLCANGKVLRDYSADSASLLSAAASSPSCSSSEAAIGSSAGFSSSFGSSRSSGFSLVTMTGTSTAISLWKRILATY